MPKSKQRVMLKTVCKLIPCMFSTSILVAFALDFACNNLYPNIRTYFDVGHVRVSTYSRKQT